jgi:hypothetical protein
VQTEVAVDVFTRWHPKEIAAGVSDLEVFEIVAARPNAALYLIDNLHAKIYVSDEAVLTGSANLTAPALGWCRSPNLEILLAVSKDAIEIQRCLDSIVNAREATEAERNQIRDQAAGFEADLLPDAEPMVADLATSWLPLSGGPSRLFQVYVGNNLDRLTSATVQAARYDLDALGLPGGLSEPEFDRAVAARFVGMPALGVIMSRVADDLSDADAVAVLEDPLYAGAMPPESQWLVIKEWFMYFMKDSIEVAPQSYIVRRRPGPSRK